MRRRRPKARIERSEIGRKLRVCAQRSEHIAQPRRRIAAGNSRSRMRIAAGNSRSRMRIAAGNSRSRMRIAAGNSRRTPIAGEREKIG